jgi:uncharacterized membrane-anchored protein YhcB (DUF1043 family)
MIEITIAAIIAFIVGAIGGAIFYRRHAVRLENELNDARAKIETMKKRMK